MKISMKSWKILSFIKDIFFYFLRVLPVSIFALLVFVADQTNINTLDVFILILVMYISILESLYRGVLRDTGLVGSYITLGILFFLFAGLLAAPANP